LSAGYFAIAAPAARREMNVRLASIREAAISSPAVNTDILRQEVLSSIPALDRLLLNLPFSSKLQLYFTQAGVTTPLAAVLLMSMSLFLAVVLAGLLTGIAVPLILLLAVGASLAPFGVIGVKRRRRFAKLEEQLPDAIDLLARAVRAGHAFTTGFSLIADEMAEPIASEFRTTYEQQNYGLSIGEALRNMTVRAPLPDLRIFVAGLAIQRETGGNLAEILDNLSKVIRDRFVIFRQVEVFTAEGRLSLYMLSALPPISGVLLYFLNPKYMSRLFTDSLGHSAIAAAFLLQVIGYLVIRRIVRIKV
jgi:tight adherence protein B